MGRSDHTQLGGHAGHNAFVYVYRGEASFDARILLVSGQPLNVPIVQYGSVRDASKNEIYQARSDFRDGRLGESASR